MYCKSCGCKLSPNQLGYCSDKCMDNDNKRRTLTDEQRQDLQELFDRWHQEQVNKEGRR